MKHLRQVVTSQMIARHRIPSELARYHVERMEAEELWWRFRYYRMHRSLQHEEIILAPPSAGSLPKLRRVRYDATLRTDGLPAMRVSGCDYPDLERRSAISG
jgi:hypothetical protein